MSEFKEGDRVYLYREITTQDWLEIHLNPCIIPIEVNKEYIVNNYDYNQECVEIGYLNWYPASCFKLVRDNFIERELAVIKDLLLDDKTIIIIQNHEERNMLAQLYNTFTNSNKFKIYDKEYSYLLCNYFLKRKTIKSFYGELKENLNDYKTYNFSDLIKPILEYHGK